MNDGSSNRRRRRVVLTGAWAGGKTTFINELRATGTTGGTIVLPEAAPLVRSMGYSVDAPHFQRAVVLVQHALEDAVEARESPSDARLVVSHRGSLDALAFWLRGGGTAADFYAMIDSSREAECARYDAVILFETTARGAPEVYDRYRQEHPRPVANEAEELDRLLEHCWRGHPRFARIANGAGGWAQKSAAAHTVLKALSS